MLMGVTVSAQELAAAARDVCQALDGAATPLQALHRAQSRLECSRRAAGGAFSEALLLDGSRFGAASNVPDSHLASDAAGDALQRGLGLVYGAHTELAVAPCLLPSEARPAPVPTPPAWPSAQADEQADDDGGTPGGELAATSDAGRPDAGSPAAGTSATGLSHMPTLLLRAPDGSYQAAMLSTALPAASAPRGFLLLPGQLLLAGDRGVAFSPPAKRRDFVRDPAPAARAYAALAALSSEAAALGAALDRGPAVWLGRSQIATADGVLSQELGGPGCALQSEGTP